jgi:hypothetical protein
MRFAPILLLALAAGCGPATGSDAESAPPAPKAPAAADAPRLSFPIACKIGETCAVQNYMDRDPGPGAADYRCGTQTYDAHNGVDIRLPDLAAQRAGVDVLAAAPGRVARLRDGVADISVKAAGAASVAGQECGNGVVIDHGGGWETQYCHLARGSLRVKVGDQVTAGAPIAQVGLSGNTEYPHLHLTVRKAGVVTDPFAPGTTSCGAADGAGALWDTKAAAALAYKPGVVLNVGFASGPVSMTAVEEATPAAAARNGPALLAYVRAINLQAGDVQALVLKAPDGAVVAQNTLPALDRAKAQYVMYVGKRTPAAGWAPGVYTATYAVQRSGKAVLTRSFELRL